MLCGSRFGFLLVCACVLWVKIGLVFLALIWCVGFVVCGVRWGILRKKYCYFFPRKVRSVEIFRRWLLLSVRICYASCKEDLGGL